jgi:predicted enzyme related to lactoylglutathione lyase
MTLQVQVGDVGRARRFYAELFGSEPDFEPHEDFLEWRAVPGTEVWFQVVGVPEPVRPLLNRVRFGVADVDAARSALVARGIEASAVTTLPGVVRWLDFEDPWGNRLGHYQDLAPSGTPEVPGGSVHDDTHFVVDG